MPGLFDLEFLKSAEGQGLLGAVAGYAANAQRGAPINSIGRGGLAGLFAYGNATDRQLRQQEQAQEREYRGLKISQLRTDATRQLLIQDELRRLDQEQDAATRAAAVGSQLDSQPADQYGTASLDGVPLFSADGAARFGNQPIDAYNPPQPQTSMPTAPVRPVSFNVGRGDPVKGELPYLPPPAHVGNSPGGGFSPAGAGFTGGVDPNRLIRQARVYEKAGDMKTAAGLYELAQKYRPEFATDFRQVTDPRTGELINVMVAKDGSVTPVPYGVKPDIQFQEAGGHVLALDKNNTRGGMSWQKSPTQADRISAGNLTVSQQRLKLDQDRFAFDQNRPQYMQTNEGLVALPTRPAPGAPIVGRPITGPNGESLGAPLKPIPANVNTAIVENAQNLERARTALALIRGQNVGTAQGDSAATGWKGFAPQTILNRLDPAGVDTRAGISDLGSALIHQRSGAAVSAAEFPRLAPFIPSATDDAATVEKKLENYVRVLEEETRGLSATYSKDQGYRPSPVIARMEAQREEAAKGASQGQALPADPTPKNLTKGTVYELPNGKRGRWNGMTFVVVGQK